MVWPMKVATNAPAIPEPGRQYEAVRAIRTGREETPDDARDEADHDDPDNVRHEDLPLSLAAAKFG
jgi:hypothetical protein